jgi:hypothetical protein
MKAAPFEYSRPADIDEACAMLAGREYSNGAAFMGRYAGLEQTIDGFAPPARHRQVGGYSDIVVSAPIWLKSLSHYRNRKKHRFQACSGPLPHAEAAQEARQVETYAANEGCRCHHRISDR